MSMSVPVPVAMAVPVVVAMTVAMVVGVVVGGPIQRPGFGLDDAPVRLVMLAGSDGGRDGDELGLSDVRMVMVIVRVGVVIV